MDLNLIRRIASSVALALLLFAGVPGIALASTLPSGVHADPGSPAGKEYAIPLNQARGGGGGGTSGGRGGGTSGGSGGGTSAGSGSGSSQQLFGSGITAAPTAAAGGSGAARGAGAATGTGASAGGADQSTAASDGQRTQVHKTPVPRPHKRVQPVSTAKSLSPAQAASATVANQRSAAAPAANRALGTGHSSGLFWMLGIAAAVLLVGLLASLAVKLRNNRSVAPGAG